MRFRDLPAEIRNEIYGLAITDAVPKTSILWQKTAEYEPAITKVCTQFRHEALPIFYGSITPLVDGSEAGLAEFRTFIEAHGEEYLRKIKALGFYFPCGTVDHNSEHWLAPHVVTLRVACCDTTQTITCNILHGTVGIHYSVKWCVQTSTTNMTVFGSHHCTNGDIICLSRPDLKLLSAHINMMARKWALTQWLQSDRIIAMCKFIAGRKSSLREASEREMEQAWVPGIGWQMGVALDDRAVRPEDQEHRQRESAAWMKAMVLHNFSG